MNQILVINDKILEKNIIKKNKDIIIKNYIYVFFFSISLSFILLFYLCYSFLEKTSNLHESYIIKNKYNINSLYTSTSNHSTLKLSNNAVIIGSIDIPKLNISYPIIENTTKEFLKISVCRFSGPLPNRIGNLCIAGHNYKNNSMFSNLHDLNIRDSFFVTDLNNTNLEYIVYDKYIVEQNNLNCTQNTDNIEVTLITCNSLNNSERIIIKAKMKGT